MFGRPRSYSCWGTAFGIWTPVAPPYDVNANRNFAGNPLP